MRQLQPQIIMNNRLGGGVKGDIDTPEQYIPSSGGPEGRDWETCMTMNNTWGFKRQDTDWKSSADLIRKLVDIAHKGGSDFQCGEVPDVARHHKVSESAAAFCGSRNRKR